MKICPKCSLAHSKPGIYCCRSCANSRTFSESSKEKKRLSALRNGSKPPRSCKRIDRKEKVCTNCQKSFFSSRTPSGRWKTYCSDWCYSEIRKSNATGIKKQLYNGIWYDSGWEVELAKWFDETGIQHERPKVGIIWIDGKGKERKYFPDFFLPKFKIFVDPKNPLCIIEQQEKLDIVSKQIPLLYGDLFELKDKLRKLFEI